MRALPAWVKVVVLIAVSLVVALLGRYRLTSSESVEVSVLTSLLGSDSLDLPRAVFERLVSNVEIQSGADPGQHFYVTTRQRRTLWEASNSGSSGIRINLRAKRLLFGGLAPATIVSATSDGVPIAGL